MSNFYQIPTIKDINKNASYNKKDLKNEASSSHYPSQHNKMSKGKEREKMSISSTLSIQDLAFSKQGSWDKKHKHKFKKLIINQKEGTTDKLISLIITLATTLDNIEGKLENLPNHF